MAKKDETANVKFHTPIFRVSFPQVFQPRAVVAGQDAKYSVAMLFPKNFADPKWAGLFPGINMAEEARKFEELKKAVSTAAALKWGADRNAWPTTTVQGPQGPIKISAILSPWHDGTEKDYDGYDASNVYASASSKVKPGLVDAAMNPIITPNEFYGGCYARATLTVFAYDNRKMGVSFGLRNIQKVRDGEPFTGAGKPEDDFNAIPSPAGIPAGATSGAAAPAGDPLGV